MNSSNENHVSKGKFTQYEKHMDESTGNIITTLNNAVEEIKKIAMSTWQFRLWAEE